MCLIRLGEFVEIETNDSDYVVFLKINHPSGEVETATVGDYIAVDSVFCVTVYSLDTFYSRFIVYEPVPDSCCDEELASNYVSRLNRMLAESRMQQYCLFSSMEKDHILADRISHILAEERRATDEQ
jgi:hypothetical protein